MKKSIWINLRVLSIQDIPTKYASFKGLFMDLSKHQEVGINGLMKKSESLVSFKIRMSHVYIAKLVGVMLLSLSYMLMTY